MTNWNWYVIKAAMHRLLAVLGVVSWVAVGALAVKQGGDTTAISEVGSKLAEVCLIGN